MCINGGKRRIMYISAKIFNCNFKRNILGKMIVLHIQCINLCPEKCILGQILIYCQELGSEQLKCFPVSSSTRSLGEVKFKLQSSSANFLQNIYIFKITNVSLFVLETPHWSYWKCIGHTFKLKCLKLASRSNTKNRMF